jgi:hypothetical protein
MDEEKHESPQDFEPGKKSHAKVNHEASEISIPTVLKWVAGLTAAIFITMIVSRIIFSYYTSGVDKEDRVGIRLFYAPEAIDHFPNPQLQAHDAEDMAKWRAYEDSILNTYGWADEDKQMARIPIQRAMALLLAKGLPTRNEANGI